jgi:hypothetical protein
MIQQNCLFHPSRQAVARCPSCRNFYCRECVTEHDDRLICAACLKKLTPGAAMRGRRFRLASLAPAAGLLIAWLCFYVVGWLLSRIPSDLWSPV